MAALNRYRPLDDGYRGFVELVAGHIAAGVGSARSYRAQQQRAEELAELDRAKTTFFSNVSHEFRTPLTLILGPVDDLRGRADGIDEQARHELDLIHRNGLRLAKLVNTLLDFSRIEAGRMQRPLRARRPGGRHRRTGQRVPIGDRSGRAGVHRGLPAARRTGVPGPRDVGEGDAEPALQRAEVHLRRLHHRPGGPRGRRRGGHRHRHRHWSARRRDAAALRALSPHRDRRAPGPTRAAESGWPWSRNWSDCTVGPSPRTAGRARERPSPSACRSARPTCRADELGPAPAPARPPA